MAEYETGGDGRPNASTLVAHATNHQPTGTDAMAVDAVAGTGSLRTLGTGATSACAGNDARLSDTRTPSASSVTPATLAVEDAQGAGVALTIYKDMPSGGSAGTADDVVIYSAAAPFKFRVVLAHALISASVSASFIQLRDATGGGGNAIGGAISSAATGTNVWTATATGTIAANGTLVARRSDRSAVGEIVIQIIKET